MSMKEICFAVVCMILVCCLTACGAAKPGDEEPSSPPSSVVESTPEPTEEPTPEPKSEPTPEPTPEPTALLSYDELPENEQAVLEEVSRQVIDEYFQMDSTLDGPYQSRWKLHGEIAEGFVGYEAELDSVYTLSENSAKSEGKIVFLYVLTELFQKEDESTYTSEDFYAISIEGVHRIENGSVSYDPDTPRILQIADENYYDFYDIYEAAILSQEKEYSVEETVISGQHEQRMGSRENNEGKTKSGEQFIRIRDRLLDPNLRHSARYDIAHPRFTWSLMMEADVRGMNPAQLRMFRDLYYCRNWRVPHKNDGYSAYIEYNQAFLDRCVEETASVAATSISAEEAEANPLAFWEAFRDGECLEYLFAGNSSDLEYAVEDVNGDDKPEFLMRTKEYDSEYDEIRDISWVFALHQGRAVLVEYQGGFGSYRSTPDRSLIVPPPYDLALKDRYLFYQLENGWMESAFSVSMDGENHYIYKNLEGNASEKEISEEEYLEYISNLVEYDWKPLDSTGSQ